MTAPKRPRMFTLEETLVLCLEPQMDTEPDIFESDDNDTNVSYKMNVDR